MKRNSLLILICLFALSGCVSVRSVVDSEAIKEPFKNPVFFIFNYDDDKKLGEGVKTNLEELLKNDNLASFNLKLIPAEGFVELDAQDRIKKVISENSVTSDIIFTVEPDEKYYERGKLLSMKYVITGVSTKTKKEVWKADFYVSDSFRIDRHAKSSAKKIFEKLKIDKVL